jgi:hypothetical protein
MMDIRRGVVGRETQGGGRKKEKASDIKMELIKVYGYWAL